MRGVDLRLFDFDWDLTWVGLFMNADGAVYGRYGGRDDHNPDRHLSLAGLKHAMREALSAYTAQPQKQAAAVSTLFPTVDEFPAAKKMKPDACIHCHQVTEFQRDYLRSQGKWTRDQIWTYPPPQNIGITLDEEKGALVSSVRPNSPAARVGVRAGDRLRLVAGIPVATFADVQYALQRAGSALSVPIHWQRAGSTMQGLLELPAGWRESDISWRATMWSLSPPASVYGEDLTAAEKRALDIPEKRLAFRMGDFVPKPSREAGIRAKDIILGIDGKNLEMNMLQFNVWIRLNFKPGDRIVYDIIRGGQNLQIPMVLADRDSF